MFMKEPRERMPKREVRLAAGEAKRKKKGGAPVARVVNHSYTDLGELADDPVARKRRKIQERVRSKRDSAKEEEGKKESVYDFMHFDPDKEALKKKKERILKGEPIQPVLPAAAVIPSPPPSSSVEQDEEEVEDDDGELADTPLPEVEGEIEEMETDNSRVTVITPTFSEPRSILGSFSRPASPKPSESEIKALLEEMEEGELSEEEEEYNKLISDVETTAPKSTTKTLPAAAAASPKKKPVVENSPKKKKKVPPAEKIPAPVNPTKTIPFLSTLKGADKKEVSILDDLAFLTSIRTKYDSTAAPTPATTTTKKGKSKAAIAKVKKVEETQEESIEMKSKELIEQLLRQDKISKDREKQRKNKEKQREKDKKERERVRQERKKEKAERKKVERDMSDLLAAFLPPSSTSTSATPGSPSRPSKAAVAAATKLKTEFSSNFVKGELVESTHDRSAIDNTVLSGERQAEAAKFVETSEHRYDNGLVIQTSTKKLEDTELLEKTRPVRYDFSKVNAEYPDFAVAGAIAYRLREKKQKLIHRVVDRIGKEKALELLFKTEDIERSGGQMTAAGDRKKEPGGVYLGLLRSECNDDDVKYIFTVEDELTIEQQQTKKKHQRMLKRRKKTRKNDKALVDALENTLSISSSDKKDPQEKMGEEEGEDPVLGFIPNTTHAPIPYMEKPKKFELSYTKPVEGYQLVAVQSEDKNVTPLAATKMASMIKGYGAFVKKGTSLQTDVFKPSVQQVMTHEPDLFDSLLRETSDKQRAAAAVDPTSGEQVGEELVEEEEVKEDIKIGPQKPVPQPMKAWDAPVGLNSIAPDRATAIRNAAEEGELSEGECSGSDNEMK